MYWVLIIIVSLMTQINDNIGSKYAINNNMVSVIFKYNIAKGLIPIIDVNIIFIHHVSIISTRVDPPL